MAGRVIAITGAFGVLGQAVAQAAAAQGARLALLDFAPDAPAGSPSGPDVLVLGGVDLTDATQAGAAVDAVADRFGGLDALLNIAAPACTASVRSTPPSTSASPAGSGPALA